MWSKYRAVVATCFAALIAAALICVPAAYAKDYEMGPVNIAAQVKTDASLDVTENRTFSFDGDYTFVYWQFNKNNGVTYKIKGVEEIDGDRAIAYAQTSDASSVDSRPVGHYYVEDSSDTIKISVFFRKDDEKATFRLIYTAAGAAQRYQDTGEVYWQAVGSEWGAPTKDVSISAALPMPEGTTVTPGENVRAWAHGPLNGTVNVGTDGVIALSVPRVDPGTFVELRSAFPQEWLSKTKTIDKAALPGILEQEAEWANQANAKREAAKRQIMLINIGVVAFGIALVGFSVFAFFKWGREHKTQFNAQYLREVPTDLHPAVVGSLWNWGSVGEKELTATLMNLSVQKIVKIEPISYEEKGTFRSKTKEDYELTIDRAKAAEVTNRIDLNLLKLLFTTVSAGKDTLTFNEIKAYGKKHPEKFTNAMNDWKAEVKAVGAAQGFFEGTGTALMIVLFLLAIAEAGLGIFGSISSGSWFPGVVGVVCAIPVGVIATQMRRRSPEASELMAKYRALNNYLKDFSKLDEAPPMHVILWERFLVMAVIFGISDQVIKQLAIKAPEVMQDPAFLPIYFWMMPHGSMGSPMSAFNGTVLSTSQVAQSAMSSASGAGGGFSGGGGGGFGGGGGGAG